MIHLRQIAPRIDRGWVFLGLILILYLWDLAYFVGLRNPDRLPHPFSLFTALADIEVLRGFSAMLRDIIFSFASGVLIGMPVGAMVLSSPSLVRVIRPFLRIIPWFPLLLIFAIPQQLLMWITAVALSTCYHYIGARWSLCLQPNKALKYAANEGLLHAVVVCLIAQLFVPHWQWFIFTMFSQLNHGLQTFATLACLVGLIQWCFKSNFESAATNRAAMVKHELERNRPSTDKTVVIYGLTLLTVMFFTISLVFGSDIWGHIGLSLLEVTCGLALGCLVAQICFVLLCRSVILRKLLFLVLPLTYISAIVLWLVAFVMWPNWISYFMFFWHKVIAVGSLTFYPLIRSLWGLRDRPMLGRFLLAIDEALPIAFVGMFFGEAYAATQGVGFFTLVAKATNQSGQAISASLLTIALIFALSTLLRWTVKIYSENRSGAFLPNDGSVPGVDASQS